MATAGGRNARQTWRFDATSTVEDGETILRLEGRIGHNGAALLKRVGEGVLGQGVNRLALDLSGVDYMSSAGLRAIEELAAAVERESGQLRVMNATDPVRLVLDLSGLASRLAEHEGRAAKDEERRTKA
jgi:anti-sigma B factor antagonist